MVEQSDRHPVANILHRDLCAKVEAAHRVLADYELAINAEPDNDDRIDDLAQRFQGLATEASQIIFGYRLFRDIKGTA